MCQLQLTAVCSALSIQSVLKINNMAIPAGVTKWKKIFLPNISSTFSKFSKPINIRNSFLPQQRQLSLFSPKLCQESEQQNQARRSILVF